MQKRQQPETLRLHAVMPTLTVKDVEKSIIFYRDILGFFLAETFEEDGRLVGAFLKAGSVEFLLNQDDFAQGRERRKGEGLRLIGLTRQDIDKTAKAIESRGGTLTQEPTDQAWGARDFAVVDPDGFKISISSNFRE